VARAARCASARAGRRVPGGRRLLIGCSRCGAGHPLGAFSVGDKVVLVSSRPRADGLQPGTKGTVVSWTIPAGAQHQEVHVRRKGGQVAAFSPCELAPAMAPANKSMSDYRAMSREEFRARLRERRAVVHVLSDADAAFAERSARRSQARR